MVYFTFYLKPPIRIYVPYKQLDAQYQPRIKVSLDNSPWRFPVMLQEKQIPEKNASILK